MTVVAAHPHKARNMVSKTREKLIDVARQLFARKGVENTTMLDIAEASEKGRRTIYTYFKNKREIHQAVIERESEQIVARQRQILASDATAARKLSEFLKARLEIVKCPTGRFLSENVSDFLRLDFKRAEKTRRLAAKKEIEILRAILDAGVSSGEFTPTQARRAAVVVVMALQGYDNPNVAMNLEALGFDREGSEQQVIDFILQGLRM